MAYTIIEVERKTGVASRTIRFWLDKGLFPYVEKDENGIRYFSENDLQWVLWVDCYRQIGMSIEQIKAYIALCAMGEKTAAARREIILEQKQKVLKDMENLKNVLEKLDFKLDYYDKMIKKSKDELNPLSKDYVKRSKRVKIKA
ncbi:MerR family transcriptional regulator [Campylobacter sp. MIT 99-7217]|uniref:MerR family transcriptional regulator n=1 Tax=Campylobacter sp. MIT 99-7217 TaxID=535091 RepID=UPI00115BF2F5|nr:MerR family transcriptional regulator [Campylobacter sp. MIT 99-7217]TQR34596.1 MerR family transcriptional regulator [Campylobacter sp. MIT 99-7217]